MGSNPDETIINVSNVKAGFFDIIGFIATDEENSIQLDDAINVLQMAVKMIESVGAKCE